MKTVELFKLNVNIEDDEDKLQGMITYCFEIICDDETIIEEFTSNINLKKLKQGISESISIDFNNYILAGGCGIPDCCGGLYWDLKHEDDWIVISNIQYRSRKSNEFREISGVFRIRKKDYKSEYFRFEKKKNRLDNLIDLQINLELLKYCIQEATLLEVNNHINSLKILVLDAKMKFGNNIFEVFNNDLRKLLNVIDFENLKIDIVDLDEYIHDINNFLEDTELVMWCAQNDVPEEIYVDFDIKKKEIKKLKHNENG